MKNLVPQRSGNPVLGNKTFDGLATTGDAMTLDGTVNRSFPLVLILMVDALVSVLAGAGLHAPRRDSRVRTGPHHGVPKAVGAGSPHRYTRSSRGLFIGGISVVLEAVYPGISVPAVLLTVAIFIGFLLIYRSHLIRVTEKLRIAVFAATGAVALIYFASLLLNLIGVQVSYLNEVMAGSGALGIGVNVLGIGIAAINLLLGFDLIERGVAARAPSTWSGSRNRAARDARLAVHRDPSAALEAAPPLTTFAEVASSPER